MGLVRMKNGPDRDPKLDVGVLKLKNPSLSQKSLVQGNLDDEVSEPSRTLSISDVKVKLEKNPEVPIDNSQTRVRKLEITIPCQNKNLPHSQANISQKQAEDQIFRVLSNKAIRRTTRSMTTSLVAKRDLSIGDNPVIEVSDSSKPHPSLVPIGPAFLDLKYVSISRDNVVDIQQENHECD